MPREYRHIKMYEKEIFELKGQGLSQRQIAEKLGFPYKKMHEFFKRYNRNQRKARIRRRAETEWTSAKRWETNCHSQFSN